MLGRPWATLQAAHRTNEGPVSSSVHTESVTDTNALVKLETEPRPELPGERFRRDHPVAADEVRRLLEDGAADAALIVGAEVGPIGQVEGLEDEVHPGLLAELERPADARVE